MATLTGRESINLARLVLNHVPADRYEQAVGDIADCLHGHDASSAQSLLAKVLQQRPEPTAFDRLKASIIDDIRDGGTNQAVSTCLQSEALCTRVIQNLTYVLRHHLCAALARGDMHISKVHGQKYLGELSVHVHADPDSHQPESTSILHALKFLSLLLNNVTVIPFAVPKELVAVSSLLLLSHDLLLADASRHVVNALIHLCQCSMQGDAQQLIEPELDRLFWPMNAELLSPGNPSSCTTTAFQLWLRQLYFIPHLASIKIGIRDPLYWTSITQGLADGDAEIAKSCLQILRLSLNMLTDEGEMTATTMSILVKPEHAKTVQNDNICAEFERYCTVYENINLGRYLNQIEACMPDLDHLISTRTIIPREWVYALLCPTLAPTVQESIHKLVGNWTLAADFLPSLSHTADLTFFLGRRFLPWAAAGTMYVSTLEGSADSYGSLHGERFTAFIIRILSTRMINVNSQIIETIFAFILETLNTIFPSAVHALFEALLQSQCWFDMKKSQQILLALTTIAGGSGWSDVARDLVVLQSHKLLQYQDWPSDLDKCDQQARLILTAKREKLRAQVGELEITPGVLRRVADLTLEPTQPSTLDDLARKLDTTNYTCIRGPGLAITSRTVELLLRNAPSETDTDSASLLKIVSAVYEETEIQEYPRTQLIAMPGLVLHAYVIRVCKAEAGYLELLARFMQEYTRLSQWRVFLWAPFMTAVRAALIKYPDLQLPIEEAFVAIADAPPTAGCEYRIDVSTMCKTRTAFAAHLNYAHYFGQDERLGYAAFFDLASRLGAIDRTLTERLYTRLLTTWDARSSLTKIVNPAKTVEQVQLMLLFLEQLLMADSSPETAQTHLDSLRAVLEKESLPRFRHALEWMATRILIRHSDTNAYLLTTISAPSSLSNPKFLASVIRLAVTIACLPPQSSTATTGATDAAFGDQIIGYLNAYCCATKIAVRYEAMASLPVLWDHLQTRPESTIRDNREIRLLVEYIKSLDKYQEVKDQDRFDPVRDSTMGNVLAGRWLATTPVANRIVSLDAFEALDKADEESGIKVGPGCFQRGTQGLRELPIVRKEKPVKAEEAIQAPTTLQTKGSSWLSMAKLLDQPTTSDQSLSKPRIIVVGSLIENPTNLGGLSRVSDIFGASELYISNPAMVIKTPLFQATSVSSHLNLAICDLQVANISEFLTERKQEGYSVVGCEQTSTSVMLGEQSTKLPLLTVLLLGAEKEGIPALLLGECDMLVEIPQYGTTRSLNVQTAAGCVLYEYARQYFGRQS